MFQQHEVLRFAQLDLDWQGAGRCHGAGDNSTLLLARQPADRE
jgi:hypothetical protein